MVAKIIESIGITKCLVLDKRWEQYIELEKQCKNVGIYPHPFIVGDGTKVTVLYDHVDEQKMPPTLVGATLYPTWWTRPNAYNAWLCHKKIIASCIDDNYENVLFLEDDSFIQEDFSEIIEKCDQFFEYNEWDMIYLGWYSDKQKGGSLHYIGDDHVYKAEGTGGFHGVIIKLHVLQEIRRFPPLGPIDWMCAEFLHEQLNCYAIYPEVITQRGGYSFVEGSSLGASDRYDK